ncbi:MAG: UDP-N-acetylmuramoyl-L-alanyl-D-glutamate--2,6-diaminopimelate ligase [Clostridia bacterium]|nr:UDP-N-acetylmuramoyl-L-alanyl-D-glutamate--2,6-diaminopimelate ligase [Clostridia bacterium]
MLINEMTKDIEIKRIIGQIENLQVDNLTYDSKKVVGGTVFFCLKGENADGHNYVNDAVAKGATLIICQRQVQVNIPQIIVENSRKAFSICCRNFFGNPIKDLKLIAITGTNGKTTTSFLIRSILESAGKSVGLIGTQGAYIGNQYFETNLTTPDPQVLHKILRTMVNNKIEYVVMEVSAHSLALEKLEGICFDVGVFTNFTQDHLDYFKTMDNYKETKLKLFNGNLIKNAVLNFDDEVGLEISRDIKVPFISYGLKNPTDIFAIDINKKSTSSQYVVNICDNILNIKSNLLGEFNVYNSLAAAGATFQLGINCKDIKKGLEKIESVPGRFNSMNLSNGAMVVIDFAHTPDGIEKILTAIKQLPVNRLITIFGCGGNRDKGKRPQMGEMAEKLSDFVVLTSDNPRFENPELILDDIENGMVSNRHIRIVDRKEAINFAINFSKKGDVIAICGKGAEEYQDINGVKSPYNDFDVVIEKNEEMQIEVVSRG